MGLTADFSADYEWSNWSRAGNCQCNHFHMNHWEFMRRKSNQCTYARIGGSAHVCSRYAAPGHIRGIRIHAKLGPARLSDSMDRGVVRQSSSIPDPWKFCTRFMCMVPALTKWSDTLHHRGSENQEMAISTKVQGLHRGGFIDFARCNI